LKGCGFVPVRKPGKLPYKVVSYQYSLEYGTSTLEMHEDAIEKGEKVLVVDDLLATGGTAKAIMNLVEKLGGEVVGALFLVELSALEGRKNLNVPVYSLIVY
jgi:adenine phosphoribosyltransferase